MISPPETVKDPTSAKVARWADVVHIVDTSILATAIAAQPDYLVAGNRHFLEDPDIARKSALHIVTPARLLQLLEKNNWPP
ncbi:MAG: hypothetical protein QGH66_00365 [Dehalococcoidia bacterium]|jgi:predicted nucleic acid-binding protein|nr:hypothetical protein [Dehalococcoidia bacterium]MDP7240003.1 hypothetical protein [Dehalococcoidia bacterium]MDP7470271.1 hypothetical protein [Dehalococcoidia bacterium]